MFGLGRSCCAPRLTIVVDYSCINEGQVRSVKVAVDALKNLAFDADNRTEAVKLGYSPPS
jgi:hypothetical protein